MNDEIQRQLHDERYVTRLVSSYSHLRNYLVNGSQWTLNVFFKNGSEVGRIVGKVTPGAIKAKMKELFGF